MPDTTSDYHYLMQNRRSIRRFNHVTVSEDVIHDILCEALEAPSSSNLQPFRVAVASGYVKDKLQTELTNLFDRDLQIKRQTPIKKLWFKLCNPDLRPSREFKMVSKYPDDLVQASRVTGAGLYKVMGIDRKDRKARDAAMRRNFEFFDAPHVLFFFAHCGVGIYGPLDLGIYLQSVAMSAAARGIGTCMQGTLAVWSAPVRAAFYVPENYNLAVGMSLGYATDDPINSFKPPKKDVSTIVIKTRD